MKRKKGEIGAEKTPARVPGAYTVQREREMKEMLRVNREREAVGREEALAEIASRPGPNPLLSLPDEDRAKLFAWLRECPYYDAVLHVLKDQGIPEVTRQQLDDFFQAEAEFHWETRIERAAVEADALVRLVERSPVKFSSGILAALGQEAFRQIASGEADPASMGKLATLFLKARSDERADQMQELKREQLRRKMEDEVGQALEKLAEEVDQHPAARAAFEALRRELELAAEETR